MKTCIQASTGRGWSLSPPDSELLPSSFLCTGFILLLLVMIPHFFGSHSSPLTLCCLGEDVSTPGFQGAHLIQAQPITVCSPFGHYWSKDGHKSGLYFNEMKESKKLLFPLGLASVRVYEPESTRSHCEEPDNRGLKENRHGGERRSHPAPLEPLDPAESDVYCLWTFQLQDQ